MGGGVIDYIMGVYVRLARSVIRQKNTARVQCMFSSLPPTPYTDTTTTMTDTASTNSMDFSSVEEHQRMVDEARYRRPDFTKPLRSGIRDAASSSISSSGSSNSGNKPLKRKRIYGEDFYRLTDFNVEPKFKMMKLDHQQCEFLTPNSTVECIISTSGSQLKTTDDANEEDAARVDELGKQTTEVSKRYADPTPTSRHSSRFTLDWSSITTVCLECMSTACLCDGTRF